MKKTIKILLSLLVIFGIIIYAVVYINSKEMNTTQIISMLTTNNYNGSLQALTTRKSEQQIKYDKDEEGMGDDENPLPKREITITMKEGNNTITPGTIYPIKQNSNVNINIQIENYSVEKTIKNVRVVAYSGQQSNLYKKVLDINKKDGRSINIAPDETWELDLNTRIEDPYLQFYITADNMESYESPLYGFKVLSNRANADVVVVDHNLLENPKGVVYEGDYLKGEVVVYNNTIIGTEYDTREKVNNNYYAYNIKRRNESLNVNIQLPKKVTITNLQYKDSTGTYNSTSTGKVTINKNDNNLITITIYSVAQNERAYITFDYKINEGCENFSLKASANITSKWKFRDEFYEYHHYNCPGKDKNGWHTDTIWNGSSKVDYIVGHPNIVITQKPPYEAENASKVNTVTEGQLLVYEFDITNRGNAPAVQLELTQQINPNFAIVTVTCSNANSSVNIGKYTQNNKITATIGRLNNGTTLTIKVFVRSRILSNDEQTLVTTNKAIIQGKKVSPITTNQAEVTVTRDPDIDHVDTATNEERDRLQESYVLCAAIGEVHMIWNEEAGNLHYSIVSNGDPEHYCVEPGSPARTRTEHGFLITHEKVNEWVARDPDKTSSCPNAGNVDHYEWKSTTHWQCDNRHYTESSSNYENPTTKKQRNNLYDIGFIASWYTKWTKEYSTGWSQEQAQAIWESELNEKESNKWENSVAIEEGRALLKIGTNYKDFYEHIMDTSNNQKVGLKPKSLIEYETSETPENEKADKKRLEISVNQKEKLIKMGPFQLDYLEGRYTTQDANGQDMHYSFSGISDMYLLDEHDHRINLVNIIKEDGVGSGNASIYKVEYGNEQQLGGNTFFSIYEPGTSNTDGNTMDWYDAQKTYPRPGEQFYIEISTENDLNGDGTIGENDLNGDGKTDENEAYIPAALKLKVDFQYMRSTASICIREGKHYFENQSSDTDNCPGDYDSETGTGHHGHGYISKHTPRPGEDPEDQDVFFILAQNREIKEESLIIPVGNGITTTMKIGGFVFQDQLEGKESNYDGLNNGLKLEKDINQPKYNDINLKNIEVSLYDAETNKLVDLRTLKQERPDIKDENGNVVKQGATTEQIEDANDYTRRTNPTLTDANGYYEFRGVPIGKKYYVKFTYNGQTYLPTEYMKEDCDIKKLNEPNTYYGASDNWRQSSKGTEKPTERTAYNNMFASIGSSPLNYKSNDNLQSGKLTNGYNETFSNYELAGFYLDSNGSYQWNKDKQLIDTYLILENRNGANHIVDTSDPEYKNGVQLTEGIISKTIKNYIDNKDINGSTISGQYENKEHKYPTDDIMKDYIYPQIVNKLAKPDDEDGKTEYWRKLQFIEDCQISSYTKQNKEEDTKNYDAYPYPDYYTIWIESGKMYPNNSYALVNTSGGVNQQYDNRGTYADNLSQYTDKAYNINGPTTETTYKKRCS